MPFKNQRKRKSPILLRIQFFLTFLTGNKHDEEEEDLFYLEKQSESLRQPYWYTAGHRVVLLGSCVPYIL